MFFTKRLKRLEDAVFGPAVVEPIVDWSEKPPEPCSGCDCGGCKWLEEYHRKHEEAVRLRAAISGV